MKIETLRFARECLATITPLASDCGALCDHACCADDEDGENGVFLFPGEEVFYHDIPWAQMVPSGRKFAGRDLLIMRCKGFCERENRPLGCRIFPLTPYRKTETAPWRVRMDRRAWALCPLMRSGVRGLAPAFVTAVRQAVATLAADAEGAAFLDFWQRIEDEYALWNR